MTWKLVKWQSCQVKDQKHGSDCQQPQQGKLKSWYVYVLVIDFWQNKKSNASPRSQEHPLLPWQTWRRQCTSWQARRLKFTMWHYLNLLSKPRRQTTPPPWVWFDLFQRRGTYLSLIHLLWFILLLSSSNFHWSWVKVQQHVQLKGRVKHLRHGMNANWGRRRRMLGFVNNNNYKCASSMLLVQVSRTMLMLPIVCRWRTIMILLQVQQCIQEF